jgi:D-xylose transport system permease protein
MLTRTRWGRHLYAIGGNAEAARRAGINVRLVRMSGFVMCSTVAAFGGMALASQLQSVSPQTGGNDTVLLAVAAAVIGGTSLFGGRGRVVDAVIGGLVVAIIPNGMALLGTKEIFGVEISFSDAGPKFVVTGLILLLAASVDALSRKRAVAG